MSDLYREILVKRATPAADRIKQGGLIGLTVVCLAGSLLFMPLLPAGIVLAVVTFFLFPRFDLEYEYLYVNGDLDIDKIMHKAKRKRVFSMNVNDLEVLAPIDAIELRQYQRAKVLDYSSGTGRGRLYALVVTDHGQQKKIIFEPNDTIVEGFFLLAPRKVVRQ